MAVAVAKDHVKVQLHNLKKVQKRNGAIVDFEPERISAAVFKAMESCGEGTKEEAAYIARKVRSELQRTSRIVKNFVPTVEGIQDIVEKELISEDYAKVAKHYILYREERAKKRKEAIPQEVRALYQESRKYFSNSYSEFIFFRTYSRWMEDKGRRETWVETVSRYVEFMRENLGTKLTEAEYKECHDAILNMEVMPSMRLMWAAGKAARESNVTCFNCSYIAPTCFQDFGEIMYLLMCGTGVGYTVESENVQQLPVVKLQVGEMEPTHVVQDSKEGWANAIVLGLKTWYSGKDIKFDYSKVRPAGARLATMGGKASGPAPLISALDFARQIVMKRQGRRISNLDAHDIICKIGECVVSGGVRRSALICLSDLDDQEMRRAKEGHFYISNVQRSLANNSAVYRNKPTNEEFLDEWVALIKSNSGERGIFNRGSLVKQMPERRVQDWRERGFIINGGRVITQAGTNPCGEITLLSKQFCNLTEVVCRAGDDLSALHRKIRIAAILGTYQSSLTKYPYLSKEWKENCERECLLGVSLTGQWDCAFIRDAEGDDLQDLRDHAIQINAEYAKRFGINASTSVTCIKPSGTVSQLVDASSGMHARHSKFYIRRVRISATESLFQMLKDYGVPYFPEVGQTYDTASTFVFEFPIKSPDGSVFKDDMSALEQLEYWKKVKTNYTEHNPSVTISVGPDEWIPTAHWIHENWDIIGGLSFLPREETVYQLAPYEEITEEKYSEMIGKFKDIDFAKIISYEKVDETQGAKELACVAGVCEIN